MQNHVVAFGSNLFVGADSVLTVDGPSGTPTEFFRLRAIDRLRETGSYLTIDCDIKDPQGLREIKIFKSRPLHQTLPEGYDIILDDGYAEVVRPNGSTVIKIEYFQRPNASSSALRIPGTQDFDTALKISGDFHAGGCHIFATDDALQLNGGIMIRRNVKVGAGGIHVSPNGFAW